MDKMLKTIKDNNLAAGLIKGKWGLEKENLRVDTDGKLALTPHPTILGDKLTHPYITTDFSESQIEMITPPSNSIDEAYYMLENIHDIVNENLPKDEYLWTSSMPPIIPDDNDIPIANYGSSPDAQAKMKYREYIAEKYGKHKQLISGIHYNFSFRNSFLHELYKFEEKQDSYYDFKNRLYLTISRNLLKHQWLITYLLGANVATHSTYKLCCETAKEFRRGEEFIFDDACSYRNSICGYRNNEDFRVSFDTLDENISDLKSLISKGALNCVNEYYSPVRLKNSKDQNTFTELEKEGIEYIELRMIDLNPLTKVGISKGDIHLVHLIILSSLLYPCSLYDQDAQSKAIEKQNFVSLHGRKLNDELKEEGLFFFERVKNVLDTLNINNNYYNSIISNAINKLNGKVKPYSENIYKLVEKKGYINHHLSVAKQNKTDSLSKRFSLKGYEELELSTQILVKEALLKGLKVKILDVNENFISIRSGEKIEYIKQATKTSLDSYSTVLVMENKAITKRVLAENGVSVPQGGIYTNKLAAIDDFYKYNSKKIVIKPNNTNFGIGITILNSGFSKVDFEQGINLGFANDETVLIETFFPGEEYRFTIINSEVCGILKRVPANIIGDGKSTIEQLITIKNQDPLRGLGYKKPLEHLKLGESELLFLKNQNLNIASIPNKDELIYIRENSNISTGGDSLDFTDSVDKSYFVEAIKAAKAVGANITGVDMMIKDIKEKRTNDNATIIELNFNPAIHIHCYPYRGKNRKLGVKVLEALGF
ncbi:MAG: bifunctional glutamate--cysteine ligase GshA/glutathione synthetase GshB [Spirochaetaceae bacterium]